jgi:hypothetical protein
MEHSHANPDALPLSAADLVINELARSEAHLADDRIYYELAHVAVHELARVTKERDQARATILHLREELRRYTANVVLGRAA